MSDEHRYEALVSAGSKAEALAIAVEGLPQGAHITLREAQDVSDLEGKDSWRVSIWFEGRFGRP